MASCITEQKFPDRIERRLNGRKLHGGDKPAIEWKCGSEEWYVEGKRHRTDGPAVIITNEKGTSTKEWWKDDVRFRANDLPVIELADGTKLWMVYDPTSKNYVLHNGNGPAIIFSTGEREFHVRPKESQ